MYYYNLIILEFEIMGIFIFFWGGNFNFVVLILILYCIFIMIV